MKDIGRSVDKPRKERYDADKFVDFRRMRSRIFHSKKAKEKGDQNNDRLSTSI